MTLIACDVGLEVVVVRFLGKFGKHLRPSRFWREHSVGVVSIGGFLNSALTEKAGESLLQRFGFRTAKVAKLALLHNLGDLPEPKRTHRFC